MKARNNLICHNPMVIKMLDQDTFIEYGKILKHKNISAHGINMALQMLCGQGQKLHRFDPSPDQ